MTTRAHNTNAELRFEREEEDYVSPDDLRVIIRELTECWQLGDNSVMHEARTALLGVLRNSAQRLLAEHYQAIRADL